MGDGGVPLCCAEVEIVFISCLRGFFRCVGTDGEAVCRLPFLAEFLVVD